MGAFCASTAPSASTGPVRVGQDGSQVGGPCVMSSWTAASSDCSRPVNIYVHVKTADLYRPNARLTPERQGYQVLTPFGKLGYSLHLDPPFNSNRDYSAPIGSEAAGAAFKDTWTLDDIDLAWHGEIAEQNPAVYEVINAAGVAHSSGMKSYLIMMAVRLLEMHRLLKPSGSLYLHCDSTASHYLKMLLDAVLGRGNFRNEIVWQRTSAHNDPKRFGRICDHLLYFAKPDAAFRPIMGELSPTQRQRYKFQDEKGGMSH